ncbi:MAG: radical SAM protein [Anaerolineae bacterium]|nr:radical SAM protein [Anaerolineae bacterium]
MGDHLESRSVHPLWRRAWEVRQELFGRHIRFERPSATLAVSVTGKACALRCAHCNGHYLAGMRTLDDPALGRARSLLISGGCDREGRVPVLPRLEEIARLAAGRRLNWHVGLIDEATMQAIRPYAHVISFDFVGDDDTIRDVYGLDKTVSDYVACYEMLRRHACVVPHLTIGLHGGRVRGERRALDLLSSLGVEALVLIVFIPTPGTAYAGCEPPSVGEVVDLLAEARVRFPKVPVRLGCMRPGGEYREQLDPLAVEVGLNSIVNPARAAVLAAQRLGLRIEWGDECCVL